jgi:hypothetical protein
MRMFLLPPVWRGMLWVAASGLVFTLLNTIVRDITLSLGAGERIGYLMIWPHARPWRYSRPEPMLRSLPNPDGVAELLADALAAHAGMASRPNQTAIMQPARARDLHGAPAPMAS